MEKDLGLRVPEGVKLKCCFDWMSVPSILPSQSKKADWLEALATFVQ